MKKLTATLILTSCSLMGLAQNTFPASGNVGIGTTTPAYSLDVNGTFRTTGNAYVTNGNIGINGSILGWNAAYHMVDIGGGYGGFYASSNTAAFPGTSYGQSGIYNNTYYNGTNSIAAGTGAASEIILSAGNMAYYSAPSVSAGATQTFTQRMFLDASGNLTASSFIGAGTGLTGTASGLTAGAVTPTFSGSNTNIAVALMGGNNVYYSGVQVNPSTNTLLAGSFSGAGTGLTGTANSLNIGGTAAGETLATVTGRGNATTFPLIIQGTLSMLRIAETNKSVETAYQDSLATTRFETGYSSSNSAVGTGAYLWTGNPDPIKIYNNSSLTATFDVSHNLTVVGNTTASSFIKSGGTSSQFLKADGSIDATTYLPSVNISGASSYVPMFTGSNTLSNSTIFQSSGNVGIGTTNPQSALAVKGTITAQQVTVTQTGWSDFVFKKNHPLRPLPEVEKYIEQNNHLPDIPSAKQIESKGLDLGSMEQKQMQKIEELTLYLLEDHKIIIKQQQEIEDLKKEMQSVKNKIR